VRPLVSIFAILLLLSPADGQEVRPVRDRVGFCWDQQQMERLTAYLKSREADSPEAPPVIAGISPHDDYLYAAPTYYPLFRRIRAKEVVIFGVTHGSVRQAIGDPTGVLILDSFPAWEGPRGRCLPSPLRGRLAERLPPEMQLLSNKAHELEHSIEAMIPFLQQSNPGVRITPVMVTAMPFSRMRQIADTLASIVAGYVHEAGLVPGRDITFLISSDANHYGADFSNSPFGEDATAHGRGTALDREIVDECLAGVLTEDRIERLTGRTWGAVYTAPGPTLWCGRYAVPFGLLAVRRIVRQWNSGELEGRLLRYSDTYTDGVVPLTETGMGLTAPFSLNHWVGFFSMAFTLRTD
jgi:MEMO1 family protein